MAQSPLGSKWHLLDLEVISETRQEMFAQLTNQNPVSYLLCKYTIPNIDYDHLF